MRVIGYLLAVLVVCVAMTGCAAIVGETVRKVHVDDAPIFDRYYMTNLKQSSSANIIGTIATDGTELMSQSESVIASWTEKKKGYVFWFNMVAFDEEELTAARKYCLVFDEKATQGMWFMFPIQKYRFEAAVVIDQAVVGAPYSNENEKRIAVLKEVLAKFNGDAAQVTSDSRVLDSSAMMVRQTLNRILTLLGSSPALAGNLDDLSGMKFDHITLGKGRIRMLIENDIARVKIKIGSSTKNFDEHPDVLGM